MLWAHGPFDVQRRVKSIFDLRFLIEDTEMNHQDIKTPSRSRRVHAKREGAEAAAGMPALLWRIDGGVSRFSAKRCIRSAALQKLAQGQLAGSETGAPLCEVGPLWTAWDRLGPDKFFFPRRKMSPKSQVQGPKPGIEEVRLSAESRHAMSVTQVVDISSRTAKSCVATDWFSAPCGKNRRFSTHLSPLSRLIYRLLRRFRLIFLFAAHSVGWRRLWRERRRRYPPENEGRMVKSVG
jgi:hypothetical protein